MKKICAIIIALAAFAAAASAQSRAIGIRAGGDAEVSYQHYLGNNFLEADLGWAFVGKGLQITGVYDFMLANSGNFNFYLGPGAQINSWTDSEGKGRFGIGIGAQLGAEYQIGAIPFNVSLDWRPMWNFIGSCGSWSSLALGFRYRF